MRTCDICRGARDDQKSTDRATRVSRIFLYYSNHQATNRALLSKKVIQMDIFDQELAEVKTAEGLRYILRRNPFCAIEVQTSRQDKLKSLQKEIHIRRLVGR